MVYIHIILMYVSDTFLSFIDKLPARSVLKGRTGTCFGLLTTAGFIIASFIIFIWPVIFYFKGDYIQGSFTSIQSEGLQMYTGCDFKLALFFYQKSTGKLANHIQTKQFLNTRILYNSPDRVSYYSEVLPCSADYFEELQDKPHDFKPEDCFIVPDGLGYYSRLVDDYLSVFGFRFEPICNDPFLCTYLIEGNSSISARRMQFFKDHYFVLRFTSQYVNDYGELKHKFYESYSTQWDGVDVSLPVMWTVMETQKIFLDNSIMPWRNNQTKLFAKYMGTTNGRGLEDTALLSFGSFALLSTASIQRVYFREYKKLDWLLGMLGGGLLGLYLIFWVISNFASTLKQKRQNCQSTIFFYDQNGSQITKPEFSPAWYPASILPCKPACLKKQNKLITAGQKMIDIVELVKKQKVAKKNLELAKIKVNFEARQLVFDETEKTTFTQQQIKYEMPEQTIDKLRKSDKTLEIYNNNLSMLHLIKSCEANAENNEVDRQINELINEEKYSKYKVPKFQPRSKYEKLSKAWKYIVKAIKFVDVFGAKPNLIAPPQNSSIFSCLLTLVILILSILTFALTLKNMGVVRTYWDEIFVPPSQQKLNMSTSDDFRSVICFPAGAFNNSLVVSNERIINVQFYQYKRHQKTEEYVYHDTIPMLYQNTPYFDQTDPYYSDINLTYCMRPQNNISVEVYGDESSENQAYVGFRLTPHCFGTPSYCASNTDISYRKFYQFLSNNKIVTYIADARYFPDTQEILYGPSRSSLTNSGNPLNFTKSIEHAILMNTLSLIDNAPAWIMGEYPKPNKQILTASFETTLSRQRSIVTSVPEYRLKFLVTGRVIRVIFQAYKVDFLFATIGGCFVFYYLFFSCFAKAYNNYKIKSKLAEVLYHEQLPFSAALRQFAKWLRFFCKPCKDEVVSKIESDIDCTNLAKNVDNVYRLSAFTHQEPLHKDLSLIFLKERIKIDDEVIVEKNKTDSDEEDDEDDFIMQWEMQQRLKSRSKIQANAIDNSQQLQIQSQKVKEKQVQLAPHKAEEESAKEVVPTTRSVEKFGSTLTNLDMFGNNSQLTFEGRRTVKSVCGACCFIILFVFICILTSHFATVYSSDFNRVSLEQIVDQRSEARKIKLNVGQNFKLALSFAKVDEFDFFDVRNLIKDVGLSLFKFKITKGVGANTQTQIETVDLIPCPANYLDNFTTDYDRSLYYSKLTNAYCVPDGQQINLYGSTDDDVREYFSIKLYNKYLHQNSTFGFQKIQELLGNYIPKYHISTPIVDYRANGHQIYQMIPRSKTDQYIASQSIIFNVTMIKSTIKFDTTVLPSGEPHNIDSYDIKRETYAYQQVIIDSTDRFYQINFAPEERYNLYTIKRIKANQIFGIIGGCIAFLFFGIGCLPRSYNQFRMRYLIGCKIYKVIGKKKVQKEKKQRGKTKQKKQNDDFEDDLSDWGLLLAWIQSYLAYFTGDYTQYSSIKRYALIQSRISRDINLFHFMKNLHACESAINKMYPFKEMGVNLCRVYPKQVVFVNQDNEESIQLKKTVKREEQLVYLTQEHEFTEWQLHILLKAKQSKISPKDFKQIFADRWFDKFMNTSESHIVSKIELGNQLVKQLEQSRHRFASSESQLSNHQESGEK